MKSFFVLQTYLLGTLACVGCATTMAPAELVAARASYNRAEHGAPAKYNPADLHEAQEAVQTAERSFAENGDTQRTKDLAYTADVRVQIAEARASTTQATQQRQATINDMHSTTTSQLRQANSQLAQKDQTLQTQTQQLATEREAHAAAEKRAAQAAADLAKFASVKQEPRGMVITLSGGVLFASSKAELLPEAQLKLNSVAESLTQQDPDSNMMVEGHTDSQGAISYNQDLSQRRAQTVRDYLVSRGIASDRISSQGFGSSRSVANNNSTEGRANNRRVEIVVKPKT
jgi:outer membrane protein OmpA-like peptidoglycan-associated protein